MLGSGKTGALRAFVAARSVRSQDAGLYRRYAAVLYRQALLTRGDPALAECLVYDVLVNEAALARIAERGEDDARYRLTESVRRRCQQLAAGAAAIYPRDMAARLHAVMRRLASSSAPVAAEGSQVRTAAAGRQRARRRRAELTACSGYLVKPPFYRMEKPLPGRRAGVKSVYLMTIMYGARVARD